METKKEESETPRTMPISVPYKMWEELQKRKKATGKPMTVQIGEFLGFDKKIKKPMSDAKEAKKD